MKRIAKIAVFISGRGTNMLSIAESVRSGVLNSLCEIALVFSDRPEAPGIVAAQTLHLPTAAIPSAGKTREAFETQVIGLLKRFSPDFIVLAGFKRILSPLFIRTYPARIINIHPADPACFRGLHGYSWAFERGMKTTKITVHFVDEGVDTGSIIAQREINLEGAKTIEDVEKIGLRAEHEFFPSVLADFLGRDVFQSEKK